MKQPRDLRTSKPPTAEPSDAPSAEPIATLRLAVTTADPDTDPAIATAARILSEGGTVAFPTETVYGLAANALDPAAVARIFAAKQRPSWDPLIVHVSTHAMLEQVAEVSPRAQALIATFWPGPITLLLPRTTAIPDSVTAGRPLVGVRMPEHPLALALIRAAALPLAAPSANRFGHTSPTTAAHVLEDLDGRINAVLDGGPTTLGLESTVLDPATMTIYRPGAITPAMIEAALSAENAGSVTVFQPAPLNTAPRQALPSPGVDIRHYAPKARLLLVASEGELNLRVTELASSERLGVMLPAGWQIPSHTHADVYAWQSWQDPAGLARTLFSGLRELDARAVTTILCPLPSIEGLGLAIRDRLQKASRTS